MQKGDKVMALDENLSGTVVAVDVESVTIETQEGFVLQFKPSELIVQKENFLKDAFKNISLEKIKEEKSIPKKRRTIAVKTKKQQPAMEVDLHIQHLVNKVRGLTHFEMLNIQLDTAQRQLDFALSKRIQRVVFIHGIGEGVLKAELETLFRRYEGIKFYDADYQKYGRGATEVYIFQSTFQNQPEESY